MNDNYPSNSDKSKREDEQHKFAPAINGTASTKKGNTHKIANAFIQDDLDNVKSYVVTDVIVPAVKNLIFTTIANSLSMLMFGDIRYNGSGSLFDNKGGGRVAKTSYSKYYDQRETARSERSTRGFEFDDIVFDNRADADIVLSKMDEAIERYGVISIFDMYDLAGLDAPYTYQNYGWSNIRNARIINARGGGYIIDMPRALPLR